MSDGGNGVTSSAIALRVKVVAMFDRTHNPFDETHWVSCLRENLTSSSDGDCALQAHEIQQPEKAALVKPNQQPGTESCVVSGNGYCEA